MGYIIQSFINTYGTTILYSVFTGIVSYIGITVEKALKNFLNEKTKKDIVETCVQATEQLYKNLSSEEKLNKTMSAAYEMIAAKGIVIFDLELRMLIEASVSRHNDSFNKKK